MDNSGSVRSFGPTPLLVAASWLATAAAVCWCVFGTSDPPGRLFTAVTALVLAVIAVATTRARPRLAASDMGIEVRSIAGANYYTWPQITAVRLVHTRRLARNVPTLEIDVQVGHEDRLLIFTKLDLVADPQDVADALLSFGPVPRDFLP